MAKLIIDVSHHQNPDLFDWEKAKDQVALFIIRVQYGSKTIDRQYKNFVAKCKEHGIPYIFYAYGHFISENDAKVEAKDFIDRIKLVDPDPKSVVLDTEGDTVESAGSANVAAASQVFIDYLKAAGLRVGFYVSHNLYKEYGLDKVKADFLWLPRYGTNDGTANKKPDFPCDLWQYTENGKVDFYPGSLDLNQINGVKSLEYIRGIDAAATPVAPVITKPVAPAPAKPAPVTPKPTKTYTVRPGDTLSEIAEDHGVTVAALMSLNGITNANKIFAGQVLKISGSAAAPKPVAPAKKYYTVRSGDNLTNIAEDNKISLAQIIKLNPGIKGPKYLIYPGQKVRVK